jgi:hypothetical protein
MKVMMKKERQLKLTPSKLTLSVVLKETAYDNLPTMETIGSQLPMLGQMDPNSLTPTKELVSGGRFNSHDHTGLTESEFSIEEIAVVTDSEEQWYMLTTNYANLSQVVQVTVNGMRSNAANLSMVEK